MMGKSFKTAQVGKECVACGTCLPICPRGAIAIAHGVMAQVDTKLCVGCGKCAMVCPAAVIDLVQREETA